MHKLEKLKVHVSTRHHGGLEVDSFMWGLCTVHRQLSFWHLGRSEEYSVCI
jgi:hypothetical protein